MKHTLTVGLLLTAAVFVLPPSAFIAAAVVAVIAIRKGVL